MSRPVIPSSEIKMPVNASRIVLSDSIRVNYGCKNCEWRFTGQCRFGVKPGESLPEGICSDREDHLKQYYRGVLPSEGSSVEPGMTQFEADYNQGLAQQVLHSDFAAMMVLERKLESSGLSVDERSRFESLLRSRRKSWEQLWVKLRKFQEQRIDRETPKVSVSVSRSISPSDVAGLLKLVDGEVVDGD